ncbi:hypothetical protein [Aestuariibaculum marinum]|uniref:Uncharacterized protein n=1 Tax=Aestuariibaculum marinum TaxID=2683592 RepID=A0A8J6U7M9_9FLAO|nr:hypothetical protein [Aestuariibaculum marinum]MBD0825329.1 hypothetical protein [Aestuariibaculum marinum]
MFKEIRHSRIVVAFWGCMALYLLNISVDPADIQPDYIPEDLSFNDQESIIEIVVEKVFGFEDAFEEYDDPDTEEHNHAKPLKIDLGMVFSEDKSYELFYITATHQIFYRYKSGLTMGVFDIDTPPPKI